MNMKWLLHSTEHVSTPPHPKPSVRASTAPLG